MSKQAIAAIAIVALVVLGGGAYLATRNSSDTNSSSQSQTTPSPSSASSSSESSTAAANSVEIKDMAFTPASITVKKGTTVTWTNKDGVAHTVTVTGDNSAESGVSAGPDSGTIAPGKTYSYTFTGTGAFKYHCTIHPSMTGTVTVTE